MLAQWGRDVCGKLFDPFLRLGGIQNSFLLANQREDFEEAWDAVSWMRHRPFWAFGPVNLVMLNTIHNGISCFSTSGMRIMVKNYKKDGLVKTDYKPQPAAKRLCSRK